MKPKTLEDFTIPFLHTDGLNSKTEKFFSEPTLYLLIAFSVFMLAKPLFGTPTICQLPPDLPKESTINYMNTFCYYGQKKRTYVTRTINRGYGRGNMTVNVLTGTSDYYMWMPFIGIFHVALCIVPVLFWKVIGLHFFHGSDIICLLESLRCSKDEDTIQEVGFADERRVWQIYEWIRAKSAAIYGKSRTLIVYVIMKWLRFALFVFQFWLNAKLFASGNLFWGWEIIKEFINGNYQNPLQGEFTLITGCETQRLRNGVAVPGEFAAYTVDGQCILSGNFINSKIFLFLYWWFILLIIVCFFSALRYTLVLLMPRFRRYLFKSLIRDEDYYTDQRGRPSPDLYMGMSDPLDYLSDYLGNDGFFFVQLVYNELHYHRCNQIVKDIWTLVIVYNGKFFPKIRSKEELKAAAEKAEKAAKEKAEKENAEKAEEEKLEKKPPVEDTEHDGRGDRFFGGNDIGQTIINENSEPGAPPMENDFETGSLLLPAPADDENNESVPEFESPAPSTASVHSDHETSFFDNAP